MNGVCLFGLPLLRFHFPPLLLPLLHSSCFPLTHSSDLSWKAGMGVNAQQKRVCARGEANYTAAIKATKLYTRLRRVIPRATPPQFILFFRRIHAALSRAPPLLLPSSSSLLSHSTLSYQSAAKMAHRVVKDYVLMEKLGSGLQVRRGAARWCHSTPLTPLTHHTQHIKPTTSINSRRARCTARWTSARGRWWRRR